MRLQRHQLLKQLRAVSDTAWREISVCGSADRVEKGNNVGMPCYMCMPDKLPVCHLHCLASLLDLAFGCAT